MKYLIVFCLILLGCNKKNDLRSSDANCSYCERMLTKKNIFKIPYREYDGIIDSPPILTDSGEKISSTTKSKFHILMEDEESNIRYNEFCLLGMSISEIDKIFGNHYYKSISGFGLSMDSSIYVYNLEYLRGIYRDTNDRNSKDSLNKSLEVWIGDMSILSLNFRIISGDTIFVGSHEDSILLQKCRANQMNSN